MIKMNLLGYRTICLTQGQIALVDRKDHKALLSVGSWYVRRIINDGGFYAACSYPAGPCKQGMHLMHRLVLKVVDNKVHVDHINRTTLDNRGANLREVTRSQNLANMKSKKLGSSAYKGVIWNKKLGKWRARITLNKKLMHLGYFHIEKDAAKAYDIKALEIFGEFANLNLKDN